MALGKRAWRWRKRALRGAIVKVARGNTIINVLLTCKNEEDLIKKKLLESSIEIFRDAQGQLTLWSMIGSG